MKNQSIGNSIDWITILIYIALVIMGWMTIYSASLPIEETSIFDLSQNPNFYLKKHIIGINFEGSKYTYALEYNIQTHELH